MKKVVIQFTLLILSITLTACSSNLSNMFQGNGSSSKGNRSRTIDNSMDAPSNEMASGSGTISGNPRMDEFDRTKLYAALDKPVGKSTQWTNQNTNTTYTVVPTKKITVGGNPYCRQYTTTAVSGGNTHEINGTACVGTDGSWHPAG